jgi:hypothetical protein
MRFSEGFFVTDCLGEVTNFGGGGGSLSGPLMQHLKHLKQNIQQLRYYITKDISRERNSSELLMGVLAIKALSQRTRA